MKKVMEGTERYTIRLSGALKDYVETEARLRNIRPAVMIKCMLADYRKEGTDGRKESN